MTDWIVLDDRILVQVVGGWLMVAPGQWVSEMDGCFSYRPENVVMIMPGRPMCDLTPLKHHEPEIRRLICFD